MPGRRSSSAGEFVTHLECSLEGDRYRPHQIHGLSKAGRPLLVRYDLDAVARTVDRDAIAARAPELWRYRELLPVRRSKNIVSLGESMTPVISLPRLARNAGGRNLYVKDESRLPTGSFKARGLCVAVSMAVELGIHHIAMPTNGNAGAALAAYGSRAGIRATVFCPADTPAINIEETESMGAEVIRVDGMIDDCGRIVRERASAAGWFDASTLREPYRLEGKKTMGFELAEQFGWVLPDVILFPTGGGTGLIGMWKAFSELEAVGWIDQRRPRMVAVQAAGCAPIVRAFEAGCERASHWADAATVAAGIRVPSSIGDFLILRALRESGGLAVAVTDDDILAAQREAAALEGMLLCPEGAATYAAYKELVLSGRLLAEERAILFNCASGLKYPLPTPSTFEARGMSL